MHPNNTRIAAKRCHYNTGGYMTLAELGMAFWHDLAAPVIAGILALMSLKWHTNRQSSASPALGHRHETLP
ncbi:hypothetical protein AWZ89_12355, partial [Shigella sonnei]